MMTGVNMFDLETTGLNTKSDRIIEYGGFLNGEETSSLINPGIPIPDFITDITGITQAQINANGKAWRAYAGDVLIPILESSDIYAGHNIAGFDVPMLRNNLKRVGLVMPERPVIDTLLIAWRYLNLKKNNLGAVSAEYEIFIINAHRASDDAKANLQLLEALMKDMNFTLDELIQQTPSQIGKHNIGKDPMIAMIK